jgi:ABC-2 type transport system permease protein
LLFVRPRPSVLWSLARRDFLATRSYRLAFVLDIFYGVFDLVLYYYISRTFEGVASADLGAAPSYFAFAAVGIVIGTVVTATSSGVGYRVREEQVTGTLEALAAEPVTSSEMCVGWVAFPFSFAAARAAFYLAVAAVALELDVSQASWSGLVAVLAASAAAIAPIGILAGAAVLVFKRGQVVSGTLMYLLTILAGMVFPTDALPTWLQPLAEIVPLRYAFDGARDAIFAGTGWATDVLALLVWSLVLWPVAIVAFVASLSRAKAGGTLAQY